MRTPMHMNKRAAEVINEVFETTGARVVDWRDSDEGIIIVVDEAGLDAIDVSLNATVHGALPRRTFLEPINSGSLRLVRA